MTDTHVVGDTAMEDTWNEIERMTGLRVEHGRASEERWYWRCHPSMDSISSSCMYE